VLFRDRDGAGADSFHPMPIDVVVQETLHQLRVLAGAQCIRLEAANTLPANLVDAEPRGPSRWRRSEPSSAARRPGRGSGEASPAAAPGWPH
jgi:hypothetical protein